MHTRCLSSGSTCAGPVLQCSAAPWQLRNQARQAQRSAKDTVPLAFTENLHRGCMVWHKVYRQGIMGSQEYTGPLVS